jgi:hypothetical protein
MRRVVASLTFGIGVIAIACGGVVVFVPEPGQGDGAGGHGGEDGVVVSASSGPTQACQDLCATVAPCYPQGDCLSRCADLYLPACLGPADALVRCMAQSVAPSQCEIAEGACKAEISAYEACAGADDCPSVSCSFGEGKCACSGPCYGGMVTVTCEGDACSCYLDDLVVGQCSGGSCVVAESCCYEFFGH